MTNRLWLLPLALFASPFAVPAYACHAGSTCHAIEPVPIGPVPIVAPAIPIGDDLATDLGDVDLVISAGSPATQASINAAIATARKRFSQNPGDTVVIEFGPGTHNLEAGPNRNGSIEFSGVNPRAPGRLIFDGAGRTQTKIVGAHDLETMRVGNSSRITFSDMEMTRPRMKVTQGHVVSKGPGVLVLDIQDGFPAPDTLLKDWDQGRYFREYTNSRTDPNMILEGNDHIPWRSVSRDGQNWKFLLNNPREMVPYGIGALVGVKSKHGGNAYSFSGVRDVVMENLLWKREARGVFRDSNDIRLTNVDCERDPPINGQTPAMATPSGGPQFGQPWDAPVSNFVVDGGDAVACGDDNWAFFNVTSGAVRNSTARDAFGHAIRLFRSPNIKLEGNTFIRAPVLRVDR